MARARSELFCVLAVLCGCASGIVDQPLEPTSRAAYQPWVERAPEGGRSDDILVLLALSGGGTRAASMAYGVFKELAETEIEIDGRRRRFLDEVDVISSVSGGSFPAAYYGLYGDRIFDDFESRFLRKDVDGEIAGRVLWPPNWFLLASETYGRSDLAAEYYNEDLFDRATFRDLARPEAPVVVINSTDLATGGRFAFTTTYFDLICANLDEYPVAHAVAASSAVPVVLSPIKLENYTPVCGYTPPAWLREAALDRRDPRRRAEARMLLRYTDPGKLRYLHLVDGGIADNLGLRSVFQLATLQGDIEKTFSEFGHPRPKLIVLILVDAQNRQTPTFAESAASLGLAELLETIAHDAISNYSFDTIELVRTAFEGWAKGISTPQAPVAFEFIEVSVEAVDDPAERHALSQIPSNFSLSDTDVDCLIATGGTVLRASPEFQDVLHALHGSNAAASNDQHSFAKGAARAQ